MKRRKAARLDRAHLLDLVRDLRAAVLRHRRDERSASAADHHSVSMWYAGAKFASRSAALKVAYALRRQQRDDERANLKRSVNRMRRGVA